MSRARLARRLLAAWMLLAASAAVVSAQISPGPLSAPHASLEGNRNCLMCHEAGQGVAPRLCLDCHTALADRISAERGLHADPELQRCERCHSEHNGREFELVRFAGGERAFDHSGAGWRLEGKHARLACRDCHRADRVSPALAAREPGKDLARTFLGLATACDSCHRDPHGGTLRATCGECHGQETWKGAPGFDHARTRYPLDASHARVACLDCHRQSAPAPATLVFAQFQGRALPTCTDCHSDPHRGRLGADCASCHPAGSRFRAAVVGAGFDHERTAYPLRGRHRNLACATCHTAGRELRVPGFERCETCHADRHGGQLARVAGKPACADCHGVEGWAPARFGLEDHARSRLPIAGAHRAVPCVACHAEVRAAELPPPFRRAAGQRLIKFRFDGVACRDCHRDPHAGSLDRYAGADGCAACHGETDWRAVRFDHGKTRYPLAGRHAAAACVSCHPKSESDALRFDGRPLDCAGCHRDPHAGQLERAGVTACERCHDVESFRPARGFDHARDSRYALDGRHAAVPCAGCHPAETIAGAAVVRYKPRPLDCDGCHGTARAPGRLAGGAS
jgi:hypothetical protein